MRGKRTRTKRTQEEEENKKPIHYSYSAYGFSKKPSKPSMELAPEALAHETRVMRLPLIVIPPPPFLSYKCPRLGQEVERAEHKAVITYPTLTRVFPYL